MRKNSFQALSDSFEKLSPAEKRLGHLAYLELKRELKQDPELRKEARKAYKEAVRKYAS